MERASHSRSGWAVAFVAALFLLFYLYIWLAINPRLLYETHPRFPVFFTGSAFFKAAMVRYGGPLEYVGGFLAQSYYLPWLGALVITLVTGGICLATDAILRAMGANRLRFTSLIPTTVSIRYHCSSACWPLLPVQRCTPGRRCRGIRLASLCSWPCRCHSTSRRVETTWSSR